MAKTVNVTLTGAAGQIGYALLPRIASGQMFGPETKVRLRLLELEPALGYLHGVAMELNDCAFPLLEDIHCTADVDDAMDGTNWALLVGSAPRKKGMERSDLLKINGGIFKTQGQAINRRAASDVRVFVVGNPCNTNCLIAMNHASDIPRNRFFAMTLLDEYRARHQLAHKAGVEVNAVSHVAIWGNHSATQYPDFYNAKINGQSALDVIKNEEWLQKDFVTKVQQRGAEVIAARGASSAASAANAALNTVYNLVHDTKDGECFSVAQASEGKYGVDEGLIFSYPSKVVSGELQVIENLPHNDFAKQKFQITLDELRHERDVVRELGL